MRPLGLSNEAQTFGAISTYFVILTALLAMSPYGANTSSFVPFPNCTPPPGQTTCAASGSSGNSVALQVGSGLACAGTLALGFVTLGIALALSAVTCGTFVFSLAAPSSAIDAFHYIFAFITTFFELLTFQLPLPAWLNAILIAPALPMFYMGVKVIRGGG